MTTVGGGAVAVIMAPVVVLLLSPAAEAVSMPAPIGSSTATPELYFLLMHQTLNQTYNVSAVDELFIRAAAAGYSGVILYDHNLEALGSPLLTPEYVPSLQLVLTSAKSHGLEVMPQIASYGHSEGMLYNDPRMVEAKPATARFVVAPSGKQLLAATPTGHAPSLSNPDFAKTKSKGNRLAGWTVQDAPGLRTFWDRTGGMRGGGSVRMEMGSATNARVGQLNISTPASTTVIARCHVRVDGFDMNHVNPEGVRIQWNFDGMHRCGRTTIDTRNPKFAQFTEVSTTCLVGNATEMELWMGVWGAQPASSKVWFSNCSVAIVPGSNGLNNLVRRDGAPFVLKSGDRLFVEGQDYNPVDNLAPLSTGYFPAFQAEADQPKVTLPPTTRLKPGDNVTIEYYQAGGGGMGNDGACLTCQASEAYLRSNTQKIHELFPNASLFLRYDEMRHMHTCTSCRARANTAGELLAWHVKHAVQVFEEVAAPPRMMVWQDMFDPYANSKPDYTGSGNTSNSWASLNQTRLIIANWKHSDNGTSEAPMSQSIHFFGRTLGMQQFLCGYYGHGTGAKAAAAQLEAARGVPGVLGMIYGPWAHDAAPGDAELGGGDYTQLESYAATSRKLWPSYLASTGQGWP